MLTLSRRRTMANVCLWCEAVKLVDEDYQRKVEAYWTCKKAGISIPAELMELFHGGDPDPVVGGPDVQDLEGVRYEEEGRKVFEIDITKLPAGTRFVRFYCLIV